MNKLSKKDMTVFDDGHKAFYEGLTANANPVFDDGYKAFYEGLTANANPFFGDDEDSHQWHLGWCQGHIDHSRQQKDNLFEARLIASRSSIPPGGKKVKMICTDLRCGWRGFEFELLRASNPFDKDEVLTACPVCRDMETAKACDEAACWEKATCGWRSEDSYRHTCYIHSIFAKEKKKGE